MNCAQCGNTLEQDAKFCTSCGAKVNQETAATVETTGVSNEQANASNESAQPTKSFQDNEYVKQGKEISKRYFNFVPDAIIKPFATSQRVTEAEKVNGMITLVLFSLLLPLFSFITIKKVSGPFFDPSFVDLVIVPFIVLLIFFAVLIAVQFGVAKLMKADLSFLSVMTRFGTLMVLPTATLLVSVLFALLSIYLFSVVLLTLALTFTSIASIAVLFSIKSQVTSNTGLDVFHGIVITNVAIIIILFIIGDSIIGNLIDQIEDSFYMFPF